MYRSIRRLVAALAMLAATLPLAAAPVAAKMREGEPFHWSGRIGPGDRLEISGVNGRIEVRPASGSETTVEAREWSRSGDPERVRVEVERDGAVTRVRAHYPRGWFGIGDQDVIVRFAVSVPRGVALRLVTVNGTIDASGLSNLVSARTVNGSVHVETDREASVRTVNGSIFVRSSPRSGESRFATVNGSVRLEIPSTTSARVRAFTLTGGIESDFPGSTRRGFIGERLRSTLGEGDANVEISTINGSIRLTRI